MKNKGLLKVSFSVRGLVIFLLVLLPNVLFFATANYSSNIALEDKNQIVSTVQDIMQLLLIFMLLFTKKSLHKSSYKDKKLWLAGTFLFLYYLLWIYYFTNGMDYSIISGSVLVSIAMSLFPGIYFILIELWLDNKIGAVFACLFGIVHVTNTCINLM